MTSTVETGSGAARGWGPFTGRQLMVVAVAVVVMVMFPVGAFAVASGSNTFITDRVTGTHASVGPNGNLQTHLNGPVTLAASTVVISAGSTTVPATGATFVLFGPFNVAAYKNVRLTLSTLSGPLPSNEFAFVRDGAGVLIDGFTLATIPNGVAGYASRVYEVPGSALTISFTNNDSVDADVQWKLVGRPG